MSISLPVELEAIAEELDYERGRLIYEGAGGNEVRRSIREDARYSRRVHRLLGGSWLA